jgi:alpha-N-arabinofuranosidase
LGSNVQWVDGGDNLLDPNTIRFNPAMVALVQSMQPSVLRYPGGDQSDLYNWTLGLGSLTERGENIQAGTNRPQITYMGTAELLALSQTVHAEALFTVNVITGTAGEAAAWVKKTNVTGLRGADGKSLPKVTYWEIGNEPYLPNVDGSQPRTCELAPATYAERINAFAQAMRAVDSSIKIGIALATDVRNGIAFVSPGCKDFSTTVLGGLTQSIDFVSIHDAYLPYAQTDHPASDEFAAAMAATQSIESDLAATRALLQPYPKYRSLPFAITEYNALFSPRPGSAYIDSIASPMGALYVADALRLFASRDDILMANTWSLSANDHWGAIHAATGGDAPYGRPTYEVFRLFSAALQGVRLSAAVKSPTFDAPSLGFSAAAKGLPLIATLVTKATSTAGAHVLRVLIINKDYSHTHVARVSIANATVSSAQLEQLDASDVLQTDDLPGAMQLTDADLPPAEAPIVTLSAHSIALLTLQLSPKTP